jgi:hypothetical protein
MEGMSMRKGKREKGKGKREKTGELSMKNAKCQM